MAYNSAGESEYDFLAEPPDELKCLICLEVARDPLQHEACGKLFCRECLKGIGKHRPCPNCRDERSHYYVDNRSKCLSERERDQSSQSQDIFQQILGTCPHSVRLN